MKERISNLFYGFCTDISPALNSKLHYRRYYKKKLNLKNPKSFVEKLLWLKIYKYSNDELVKKCSDKYCVRDYVAEKGYSNILVPLICVFDKAEDIKFQSLPNQFVLKWNFGCGFNIICKEKKELNEKDVIRKMKKWGRLKYYRLNGELQYKGVKKVILCEQFLSNSFDNVIPDYKVYCFNGTPKAILVMHDRGQDIKGEFFDTEWHLLDNPKKYNKPIKTTPRPKILDYMLKVSSDLSKPFPFVRCDFYVIDDNLFFGEMTFTPAGGVYASETSINGKTMGELLKI